MARTRRYRSFPLIRQEKETALFSVLWRLSSGYDSDARGLLERVLWRERSSRHLGLERTSDAFESSQLRHCTGILEQSPRPSAKRGLLSPFTSSVSHHTQRETWSSQYSLQSPAWTRAHDDSGPYCFPSGLSQPHRLPWTHQPTPTIGPLYLPSFYRNTWILLYFFPRFLIKCHFGGKIFITVL